MVFKQYLLKMREPTEENIERWQHLVRRGVGYLGLQMFAKNNEN